MGIIIGALALFVVLSVFSGLKEFSLSFTNAIDPDLKLNSTLGKSILITPEQERQIKQIDGLVSYSKIIEERVLFTFDGKQEVTYLKGIDSLFTKVNPIEKNLFNGQWLAQNTNQVVVGYGIAQKFSMGLLDFNRPLQVFVPKPWERCHRKSGTSFQSIRFITDWDLYHQRRFGFQICFC